jgi:RNA polymerase sigma-70 factor (ECF subfamily)
VFQSTLEELFERYRTEGHLASLAEVFDRTAGGLLALATHLVRDPVEAEDLVQNTFVAAIEGARAFERGRRLEPWLAGILARQAARAWRERGRRPELEPAERGPSDPSQLAEEREIHAHLARVLATLAPTERAVLEPYLAGERP